MNIVIRADSSSQIGSGHIMRCLTLAEACRKRGGSVRFICRNNVGSLVALIVARGFQVARLESPMLPIDRADWLGVSSSQDAMETRSAIEDFQEHCDWLVVDQYGIDAGWETSLRVVSDRIMVIDDLADRQHDCDLLLDQNFRLSHEGRYRALVPETCKLAMGPKFALLQQDYAAWRARVLPRQSVGRVLIYFGGTDRAGLALMSAKAALSFSELLVDVVVSAADANLAELRQLANDRPRLTLHTSVPSLAPLIAAADLAIGAFGATSWERLCLGLPTIAVIQAANQSGVARELDDAELAIAAGAAETMSQDAFTELISQVKTHEGLADWSARCMDICDGLGAERIVDMLFADQSNSENRAETI